MYIKGKGYPDINTRSLLVSFSNLYRNIPILVLTDSDPHGFDIMTIYKFGSKELFRESQNLVCSKVHWLGLLPTDIERFNLPSTLIPFNRYDTSKCAELLKRPYMAQEANKDYLYEVEYLKNLGKKAEIENLASIKDNFLMAMYLPIKLKEINIEF
ncbi:unnamed protein product [Gordionus sp. m RMFG-2023]